MRHSNQSPNSDANSIEVQIFDYLEFMAIDQKISIARSRIARKIGDTRNVLSRDDFDMMSNLLDIIVSIEHVGYLAGKR